MIDFSTVLFFLRNGNRAQNGEGGRGFVAIGQGAKVVKQICEYDNIFGKSAKSAVNAFKTVAQNDKVFNGISKGVKFASENVNPLIVVSSGINVLTSEDKQSTVIAEAGNQAAGVKAGMTLRQFIFPGSGIRISKREDRSGSQSDGIAPDLESWDKGRVDYNYN